MSFSHREYGFSSADLPLTNNESGRLRCPALARVGQGPERQNYESAESLRARRKILPIGHAVCACMASRRMPPGACFAASAKQACCGSAGQHAGEDIGGV